MHPRTRELLTFLDEQRQVLCAAIDGVAPSLRDRRPPNGGWSVANIVEHLAIVERRMAMRIAASIGEARNAGLGHETSTASVVNAADVARLVNREAKITTPEASQPTGNLAAPQAWTALEESTAIVRGTLVDADGLAIGRLALPHPVLGPASLYQWFVFIGGHEARHAAQIRELETSLVVIH
jgi:DinB family protein